MASINRAMSNPVQPPSISVTGPHATSRLAPSLDECIEQARHKTGIPGDYLKVIHQIVAQKNCIIGFRPFDPLNRQLLEQNYPTKNLEIKGKTSDLGPLYGFIPLNQALSKLRHKGQERARQGSEQVKQCIDSGKARGIALSLGHDRLALLVDKGMMRMHPPSPGGERKITLFDSELSFTARPAANGKMNILFEGKPVQVVAPVEDPDAPSNDKPDAPDLDMCFAAAHFNGLGSSSRRSPSPVGLSEWVPNPLEHRRTEPVLSDHITPLERDLSNEINSKVRPGIDFSKPGCHPWRVVHHGSDQGNPYADMADNLPITAILPRSIGHYGPVVVLEDREELERFMQATGHEYPLTGNQAWGRLEGRVGRRASDIESREHSPAASRRTSFNEEDREVLKEAGLTRRKSSRSLFVPSRPSSPAPDTARISDGEVLAEVTNRLRGASFADTGSEAALTRRKSSKTLFVPDRVPSPSPFEDDD